MATPSTEIRPPLYEADETAWLEAMAELIRGERFDELDYSNLREYLTDVARRDRREVESRLETLITHLLKWQYQPQKRTGSWRATIIAQRHELERALGRGVLRHHAEARLAETYRDAVEQAAAATGLGEDRFPTDCPYTLEQVLSPDLLVD